MQVPARTKQLPFAHRPSLVREGRASSRPRAMRAPEESLSCPPGPGPDEARPILHSSFSILHSAFPLPPPSRPIQHSAFFIPHSPFPIQHSAFCIQPCATPPSRSSPPRVSAPLFSLFTFHCAAMPRRNAYISSPSFYPLASLAPSSLHNIQLVFRPALANILHPFVGARGINEKKNNFRVNPLEVLDRGGQWQKRDGKRGTQLLQLLLAL